jgi:outer membrane protein
MDRVLEKNDSVTRVDGEIKKNLESRMKKCFLLGAVCVGFAAALPAHADLYTADRAIAYALAHNPELLAAGEQANAAVARKDAASGARWPQLDASYSARSSNNPLDAFADKLNTRSVTAADFDPTNLNEPGTSNLQMGQVSLRVPIYAGGRLAAMSASAGQTARAAQLQYERAREVTAFNTRRAYINVQLAEQGLAIADDAAAAAQRHARTTAQLVREGRIVTSDKLTAEVNLAAVEAQRAQAATRLERARNQLKLVMGLELDADVSVTPAGGGAAASGPGALLDLENTALAKRKDLAAVKAMTQAARERVGGARAAHLPQVNLIASENRFTSGGDSATSHSVMGVVSLNLWAGGQHSAEESAAAAEAQEAQWREQAYEQRVRSDVRDAYDNLNEARARYAIAAGNVDHARETVRLVDVRYGQGRTILIDLLQAERALVEARNEELVSRLNLETGYAALELAQGTLAPPEGTAP